MKPRHWSPQEIADWGNSEEGRRHFRPGSQQQRRIFEDSAVEHVKIAKEGPIKDTGDGPQTCTECNRTFFGQSGRCEDCACLKETKNKLTGRDKRPAGENRAACQK